MIWKTFMILFFPLKSRKCYIYTNAHAYIMNKKRHFTEAVVFHWVGCVIIGVKLCSRQPLDLFIQYLCPLLVKAPP